MIEVIVFDFDGVIVDSNHIKKNAYYEIFNSFKDGREIVERALLEFEPNTRFFIIGKILDALVSAGNIDSKSVGEYKDELIKRYGDICEFEILKCVEIKGAHENIRKLSKAHNLYINSLTPKETLIRIVEGRKLSKYFKDIFGSEKSKIENLKTIISIERVLPSQVLVIGDSHLDLQCSQDCNTHFIGIDDHKGSLGSEKLNYFLEDCTTLYETVEQIEAMLDTKI